MYGLEKGSKYWSKINNLIEENIHIAEYRHSDEENFQILSDRAQTAIDKIQFVDGTNIVVVTHGYFMRMVLAKILLEDRLTPALFKEFHKKAHLDNAAISQFSIHENKVWNLWKWNESCHLEPLIDKIIDSD